MFPFKKKIKPKQRIQRMSFSISSSSYEPWLRTEVSENGELRYAVYDLVGGRPSKPCYNEMIGRFETIEEATSFCKEYIGQKS